MTFSEWCDAEKGRCLLLAAHFKRSKGAISHWKLRGPPLEKWREIVKLSEGAITFDDLVPREIPFKD